MTHVIGDRVLETTTTTGTGTITLAGAVSGYRAFSSVATVNGDTFYYQISGGSEWEVGLGTRASATTMTRTTVYASSNGGALVNFSAGTKEIWIDAAAEQLRWSINRNAHPAIHNGRLSASVAANAVTFQVLTAGGSVPSATDPVFLIFQGTSGVATIVRVAAALSITIASGATMGAVNGVPLRIWLAVLLNAGVPELIVRNCTSTTGVGISAGVQGFPVGTITTTAQAGAGDDSAQVSYSASARTTVPFFILGYFDWDDTPLATAGVYDHVPDKTVLAGPGTAMPGTVVKAVSAFTASAASATTSTFQDVLSATISTGSKCNSVEMIALGGSVLTNASGAQARLRLFNATQAYTNWGFTDFAQVSGSNYNTLFGASLYGIDYPGGTQTNQYKIQLSLISGAGTVQFPAGGTQTWLVLRELMG
jgi:hypothetical protein